MMAIEFEVVSAILYGNEQQTHRLEMTAEVEGQRNGRLPPCQRGRAW